MRKFYLVLISLVAAFAANAQLKTYTCINELGQTLFTFETNFVWDFSDEMAMFKTTVLDEANNKLVWRNGFIDSKGKVVIDAIYDPKYGAYYGFNDGVSWARRPGENFYILINKKGEVIVETSYQKVGSFHEGMCAVYQNDFMGFINTAGEEVIPCKYVGDSWFYEGLVCVCLGESETEAYGFLNKEGDVAIPLKFNQPGHSGFENGEARVKVNGKTCLINYKGEITFTPSLTGNMECFYNGLALAYTKPDRSGFGFFNRNNEWVVQPIYDYANAFVNGRAIVEKDGKYGVIDTLGKIIIPIKYDNIYGGCDEDGLFNAVIENVSYFFNCDGKYFTSHEVKTIGACNSSKLHPFKDINEMMGYLNQDGTISIDAKYIRAEAFKEGKAWVY